MAEISYPFNSANATTGATNIVSETQWQAMAHTWGGDRVDFRLPTQGTAATLPFQATVLSVTSVQIKPGKAWVGGFYYELTTAQNVTIAANTSSTGRIDLIVIRADMAKPGVNLAVRKGVNGASPVSPQPVRTTGGMWELPLYAVNVPANGGTITTENRAPYDLPTSAAFPWNASQSAAVSPLHSFSYDLDTNVTDTQTEYFNGRAGVTPVRTLGVVHKYTPAIVGGATVSARTGRWRWIAPNTVWFSLKLENTSNTVDAKLSGSNWTFGVTLPQPANGGTGQIIPGHLDNTEKIAGGLPNLVQLTGKINRGGATSNMYMYYPDPKNLGDGLNGLPVIPRRSYITFSGVYEAALFKD